MIKKTDYITIDDIIKELNYIRPNRTTIKYYLRKIFNNLWLDHENKRSYTGDIDLYHYDYLIEDADNNNNYLFGNTNYIYMNLHKLFPNNEYEYYLNCQYTTQFKPCRIKKEMKKKYIKQFSNNPIIRIFENYFITEGLIKPLNKTLIIHNKFELLTAQGYLNKNRKEILNNFNLFKNDDYSQCEMMDVYPAPDIIDELETRYGEQNFIITDLYDALKCNIKLIT